MSVSRRQFIHAASAGTAALAAAPGFAVEGAPSVAASRAPGVPKRPNLLFFWTDQHRGDCVPWAGNRHVKAPALRSLGERSFVFPRTYVTQPVCTPSRGSIMTGLWPHNHGCVTNNIALRPDTRTIAEHVPPEYVCAYYGKWHLGDEIKAQHGFTDWRSIEDIYREHYSNPADRRRFSSYHHFLLERGFPPDSPEEGTGEPLFSRQLAAALPEKYTKAAYLAGEAERFLRARRDGQPFLLSVNLLEPHPPNHGPLNEEHDPASLPVGPAFMVPVGERHSRRVHRQSEAYRRDGYKNHPFETEADFRRLRANYYGLVTLVDNALARVLRALEESGQADTTIIVYTSDHGEMMGDHLLMQKGNFFEESVRVPLAIHVPWLSRRRVDLNGLFSQVDLMPTLLDLMGLEPTAPCDGRSRAELLVDPSARQDDHLVVEWNSPSLPAEDSRSVVTSDGWKLNLYRDDLAEMFHLESDPGELHNLAGEAAHRDRQRRMADLIRAWQQRTGDKRPLPA